MKVTEESRPAGNGTAIKITGGRSTDESTLPLDHALLVTRTIRGGGIRRRVLFSLPSAQAAVARAEAAGHTATITLVQLVPVGHVDLDELEGGGTR